jgi:hypothetical protein
MRKLFTAASITALVLTLIPAVAASAVTPLSAPAGTAVTADINIPGAPASMFAGASGGDGFNVALANGHVYNVFHHNTPLTIACHDEATGDSCTYNGTEWPISIEMIRTGMYSSAFISSDQTKLYVWAINFINQGGMQCVSLADGSDCGFTILTSVSIGGVPQDVLLPQYIYADWGSRARVGNKVYSPFGLSDGHMWLACFDISTGLKCSESPIVMPNMPANTQAPEFSLFNGPHADAIDGKVYVHLYQSADPFLQYYTCIDTVTNTTCGGATSSWPRTANGVSGFTPALNADGTVRAVCLEMGADTQCFNPTTGADADVDPLMSTYDVRYGLTSGLDGQSIILGTRVITLQIFTISCTDYSSGLGVDCGTYLPTDSDLLYSIDRDPRRPACVWINADNGQGQVQNFDALTMTAGCGSTLRTNGAQVVTNPDVCSINKWDFIEVKSPTTWTSATLRVLGSDGQVLPGGDLLVIPSNTRSISLNGVQFDGEQSPYFEFNINGADVSNGLTAKVTYHSTTPNICSGGKEASTTTYTGATSVSVGQALQPSATVAADFCGSDVTYTMNRSPLTGAQGAFVLNANSNDTSRWQSGVYQLTVRHAATDLCEASSAVALIAVSAQTGVSRVYLGDGTYKVGAKSVKFNYAIRVIVTTSGTTTVTRYSGFVRWSVAKSIQFSTSIDDSMTSISGVLQSGNQVVTPITCPNSPVIGVAGSNPQCSLIRVSGLTQKWSGKGKKGKWVNAKFAAFTLAAYDGGVKSVVSGGKTKKVTQADFMSISLTSPVSGISVPGDGSPVRLAKSKNKGIYAQ